MSLINALTDLKAELMNGADAEAVIDDIAAEHDLKPVFLRNRAIAAMGDLSTWAARENAAREANAPSLEAAKRRMQRTVIEDKIRAHNAGTARVSDERLAELTDMANALGGKWHVTSSRPRRSPANIDRLLLELARMLAN